MNDPTHPSIPEPETLASELRLHGHALLPVPRRAHLADGVILLDARTPLRLLGIPSGCQAVTALQSGLLARQGFQLRTGRTHPCVTLAIRPNAVRTGLRDGRHEQAYRIDLKPDGIALTGNAPAGLFYAVQTLLQLSQPAASASCSLPVGVIEDWPEYEIRCIHWDTKHHQDRLETLRRYLDQAAEFKINAILFEIEDKFEYPSHPVIGAPGAFTTKELQSLVNYGLDRFIQIIPDVQGPAHMAYVLKHPEFAHLRCDGSNYQICMDRPDARRLLFDMYDDLCKATKGVRYFHVSTDEVYYAGICEKYRRPYNPENRSLTWVDFVRAAHAHLSRRGRRVIVWAEYPLLDRHVRLLPPDLLNGIGGRKGPRSRLETEHGIRSFLYTSMQGVELLFPNYFAYRDREGTLQTSRLEAARAAFMRQSHEERGTFIGTISAAWDDSGPHGETFWLGWGFNAQGSWTPGAPVEETVASFMDIFYGGASDLMPGIYHSLQSLSRFYEFTLERLPSTIRAPAYGDWDGKHPTPRTDRAMVPPGLPNARTLAFKPVFSRRYATAIGRIPEQLEANERLTLNLHLALTRVSRNRHNIEIFLSLAAIHRQFVRMLMAVAKAETILSQAAHLAGRKLHKQASIGLLDAQKGVRSSLDELGSTYETVRTTWEKGRHPKGRTVAGRRFVHVMDDVKDHLGDRRPDLTYLISPVENIGLAQWVSAMDHIIDGYVRKHGLGNRQEVQRDPDE